MHGEIVTSQRNLGPFSRQSNESHAYPSRPFIAMSYFLSFEPLIVPVSIHASASMMSDVESLPSDVLLSTRHSHHDPASDSHTLSHKDSQEEEKEEEKEEYLVSS